MSLSAATIAALGLMVAFGIYGVYIAQLMVRLRTRSFMYSFQLAASTWLVVAIGLSMYVSGANFDAHNWPFNTLIPLADLAKASSGMIVPAMWAGIIAGRLRGLGVGNTSKLTKVLKRCAPVFIVCFLVAAVMLLVPPPFSTGNPETSPESRAIAYRSLIAAPQVIYAAMMFVATLKFCQSQRGKDTFIRDRLQYFAVTWACIFVWGFLWAGWIVPIGKWSMGLTLPLLITGCVFGGLAVRRPATTSKTDDEIRSLERDLGVYTESQLKTKGFSSADFVEDHPGMEFLLRRMAKRFPQFIGERQVQAGLNALWFVDKPADREFAKDTQVFKESTVTAEFRPSVYGIPDECPFKAEVEQEIEDHHRACWLADILSEPDLLRRLSNEEPWIQIIAVVAAHGELLPSNVAAKVLDREDPHVHQSLVEYYHGFNHENYKR